MDMETGWENRLDAYADLIADRLRIKAQAIREYSTRFERELTTVG